MARRSKTETCCLTLPLVVEKWQSDRLEKRFEIARQIYNTLLNYELKKLRRFEKTAEYIAVMDEIKKLDKNDKSEKTEKKRKALFKKLNKPREDAGLTEYALKSDVKKFYKHFNDNIGSNVAVHGIAAQLWTAFESVLFRNGEQLHFKRRGDLKSVRGYSYSGKSGGIEIMFRGTYIEWKGLKLPIKLDPSNTYETEMLTKRVKYCRIIKQNGKNNPRWYVQLSLEGKPAIKSDKNTGEAVHPVGTGTVGIDIGPQTIAYASDAETRLMELADGVKNIERDKRLLQRKMDRSKRSLNPQNFNDDGTIKKGVKLHWRYSKRYLNDKRQLAYIQRQQADMRKRQHTELANHLLSLGNRFIVENMSWPALTKRSRKTEISEKTGKFKRKKRFGKSVGNKAPATLIRILDQKLKSYGYEGVTKVDTKVKASQYNHITDDYQKKELSQRWNYMPDGRRIQRDLYSAFLLQHCISAEEGFDKEGLKQDYEGFVMLHDMEIERLRHAPKTIASMGIVRTAS